MPPRPGHDTVQAVKRLLMKTSDICNPLRSNKLTVEWAMRIAEEYFDQARSNSSSTARFDIVSLALTTTL